ncbi:protein kinase [Kitasatospora sp. NPDC002227]|uniref:serine/threonine-protein kinase n=1 Tax=Kitasatospora sp. NPDC002227 TaxID=3154773 RepID=UPI00332131DB
MEPLESTDPEAVGPYRLLARLGAGGMGQVYLGRSAGGRTVAVKVVRAELAGDQEFRERFGREVAAARAVDGAFTAPVVDAELTGPLPWLVTSYVLGPDLATAVRAHGPLPEPSVRALGFGLAQALRAIHRVGLVHRDLKPSNVLLTADGPRVIDFGIARALDGDQVTRTGIVIGSPGYMSPEQASGRPMGPAGDVFSLGSVLFYAATGRGPFESDSGSAGQLFKVVYDQPELGGLPDGLRPAISACLAKDPARRPTPGQLCELLAPTGPDRAPDDDWLPAPLSAALTRHAAAVMDLEQPLRAVAGTGTVRGAGYTPTVADAAAPADPVTETSPGPVPLGLQRSKPAPQRRPGPRPEARAGSVPVSGSLSRRGLLATGSGVLALAAAGGAGWALSTHGAGHGATAGNAPSRSAAGADGPPPKPLWTYSSKGSPAGAPVLCSGIYLVPPGSQPVAISADTGQEVWAHGSPDGRDGMTLGGRLVFVGLPGGGAVGFETATGTIVWGSPGKDPKGWVYTKGSLLGASAEVVFMLVTVAPSWAEAAAGIEGVAGFSVATREQIWFQREKRAAGRQVNGLVVGDAVWYTDSQDNLVSRNGRDGRLLWSAATGPGTGTGTGTGFPPVVGGDLDGFCPAEGTGLQAIRQADGSQKWKIQVPANENRRFTPVTVQHGVLYGSDGTSAATAWDSRTGKALWSCPLPAPPSPLTPPVVVQETLFVAGPTGQGVHAIDVRRGRIRWTYASGSDLGQDWYLAGDSERLYATYGSTVHALPPV